MTSKTLETVVMAVILILVAVTVYSHLADLMPTFHKAAIVDTRKVTR